ncbi:hypothetical protein [Noviherbaspirillum sp.]|jgi:hypothetical protein|uniref:hypothetical protein n=1 Tax=Noviherbaspirillum sp. TaxID=1926288 RepID=UPI0025FBE1D0|nr:hypothetical protein [Noviherbaspirillum sp.]
MAFLLTGAGIGTVGYYLGLSYITLGVALGIALAAYYLIKKIEFGSIITVGCFSGTIGFVALVVIDLVARTVYGVSLLNLDFALNVMPLRKLALGAIAASTFGVVLVTYGIFGGHENDGDK